MFQLENLSRSNSQIRSRSVAPQDLLQSTGSARMLIATTQTTRWTSSRDFSTACLEASWPNYSASLSFVTQLVLRCRIGSGLLGSGSRWTGASRCGRRGERGGDDADEEGSADHGWSAGNRRRYRANDGGSGSSRG